MGSQTIVPTEPNKHKTDITPEEHALRKWQAQLREWLKSQYPKAEDRPGNHPTDINWQIDFKAWLVKNWNGYKFPEPTYDSDVSY